MASETEEGATGAPDAEMPAPASEGASASAPRTRTSGNAGFAGYEYQIDVTVWAALDLVLAKTATDVIVIEPPSDEDLEAAISDASEASSWGTTGDGPYTLALQAKSRSRSPWTPLAISRVLLGEDEAGRRKRLRPLAMLQQDPTLRYVFVTNEASTEALRPHEGDHFLDFPDVPELPPHLRDGFDSATQASLAPRILLLTNVTFEVLAARIRAILSQHGHVPPLHHDACIEDTRKAVRERMRGESGGRLTRANIVKILVGHGGSLSPTRDMDRYVRPRSFDAIRKKLDTEHAVVISGPSGTGKTLTADILEYELRCAVPPFAVVGAENGPGGVRQHLTRSDPVVFHLRDPWGGNRLTPGADRWSGELPKLLQSAGAGRRFLVTSRSDVLRDAGRELNKDLEPYTVAIQIEDYGPERIARIYDGLSQDLGEHPQRLAALYRERALAKLTRPYEVKRFMIALAREDEQQPRALADLLNDSQIGAISAVIASQMAPLGAEGAEAAAVIWGLLEARGAVPREFFAKLARRLRAEDPNLRPDIDGMIDFLVAGQNLSQDGVVLSFQHPRVEDGLRVSFLEHPRDAEYTFSIVAQSLLQMDAEGEDWGSETALRILRSTNRLEDIVVDLDESSAARLDQYLETVAASSEKRADFESAMRDLAQFGSQRHLPSRLARILVAREKSDRRFAVLDNWRSSTLSDEAARVFREDPRTRTLLERFIREVLPFISRSYSSALLDIIENLAPGISEPYWDALEAVAGPKSPSNNIEVIVAGALSGPKPDFDRAIDCFARSAAEADKWFDDNAADKYAAEEHELDVDHADHVIEEPGEQYYSSEKGMNAVVGARREREGIAWIASSPHKPLLLAALARIIADSDSSPQDEELAFLLKHAEGWNRTYAWRAVRRHWTASLGDALIAELARPNIDSSDRRLELIKIAALNGKGDPLPDLIAASKLATASRNLEIVFDIFMVRLRGDFRSPEKPEERQARAKSFSDSLPADQQELARALVNVLAAESIDPIAEQLTAEARDGLADILERVSIDVAGVLACLAARAGIPVAATVDRLLATDDASDGKMAMQAILMAHAEDLQTKLYDALRHRRYPVRCAAIDVVTEVKLPADRGLVIAAAKDHSSDVRLAFAQSMRACKWPEAIDALVDLLDDTRDFANWRGGSTQWSKFSVARAAAHALKAYDALPASAVEALTGHAKADGRDPFAGCGALLALANQDDPRVADLILAGFKRSGLENSPTHRPRAQAAAWALWDRVVGGKLDVLVPEAAKIAEQEEASIAAPVLAAFGLHAGPTRDALLVRLETASGADRAAIVRVFAATSDARGLELDEIESILALLTSGSSLEDLQTNQRDAVEAWSQSLDVDDGWQRIIAWVASKSFGLPIYGEIENIRQYLLPEQVATLSMRSLTPFREIGRSGIDDGL